MGDSSIYTSWPQGLFWEALGQGIVYENPQIENPWKSTDPSLTLTHTNISCHDIQPFISGFYTRYNDIVDTKHSHNILS